MFFVSDSRKKKKKMNSELVDQRTLNSKLKMYRNKFHAHSYPIDMTDWQAPLTINVNNMVSMFAGMLIFLWSPVYLAPAGTKESCSFNPFEII